jgi:hypothetical protein
MDSSHGELGVMLYGYDRKWAQAIGSMLSKLLGEDVAVLSGSRREGVPISAIIGGESSSEFDDGDVKVMMFLGFDDAQVSAAVSGLPRDGSIPRPIFCAVTESNVKWPLSELIEHLLEEKRYWEKNKIR